MLLDYLTTHTSLSPIRRGLAPGFVNYKSLLNNNTLEVEIRKEHQTLYKLITMKSVKMEKSLLNRFDLIFWCLTPFSAIFQLYHGDQF
jgi:hypothetical protein